MVRTLRAKYIKCPLAGGGGGRQLDPAVQFAPPGHNCVVRISRPGSRLSWVYVVMGPGEGRPNVNKTTDAPTVG